MGSTPLMGAYKGYGLALMVQFLSGALAGGAFPGANKLD
ncbi:Ldh family oxidoreductase [Alphaproteobacteria bacterium]|nr:Ldh family oxidoreductase [Alphaproteobacteria bacterium]